MFVGRSAAIPARTIRAVVLTLLQHARPRAVLEIGTALGHMTANLTRWTGDDARIFTIDLVRGMSRATPGAVEQQGEVPDRADWSRFANHFGKAHKAFFITADTMTYDFGRLAPLDFAFIDGAHDEDHVLNDSGKVYEALARGGWLVWHDFNSPVPWVKVREAIERMGFAEPVVHVEGTEVAFLRKGDLEGAFPPGVGPCRIEAMPESNGDSGSQSGRPEESDKIGSLTHGRVGLGGRFPWAAFAGAGEPGDLPGVAGAGRRPGLIQVEAGPPEDRVALDDRLAA